MEHDTYTGLCGSLPGLNFIAIKKVKKREMTLKVVWP